jgi:hypothetical protein
MAFAPAPRLGAVEPKARGDGMLYAHALLR